MTIWFNRIISCVNPVTHDTFAGAVYKPSGIEHSGGVFPTSHLHDLPVARPTSPNSRRHGQPYRRHHQSQGPDGLQLRGKARTEKASRLQHGRRRTETAAFRDERDAHRLTD